MHNSYEVTNFSTISVAVRRAYKSNHLITHKVKAYQNEEDAPPAKSKSAIRMAQGCCNDMTIVWNHDFDGYLSCLVRIFLIAKTFTPTMGNLDDLGYWCSSISDWYWRPVVDILFLLWNFLHDSTSMVCALWFFGGVCLCQLWLGFGFMIFLVFLFVKCKIYSLRVFL